MFPKIRDITITSEHEDAHVNDDPELDTRILSFRDVDEKWAEINELLRVSIGDLQWDEAAAPKVPLKPRSQIQPAWDIQYCYSVPGGDHALAEIDCYKSIRAYSQAMLLSAANI
ncbi:unnamed protein product [Diplocarpon coronariae]